MANVVLTCLLVEATHRHVFDHTGAQRADGLVGSIRGHQGCLSRAEGCWTFNARDPTPRSSRPTARHLANKAPTVHASPSRGSGFVRCPFSVTALRFAGKQINV